MKTLKCPACSSTKFSYGKTTYESGDVTIKQDEIVFTQNQPEDSEYITVLCSECDFELSIPYEQYIIDRIIKEA